MSRRDKIHVKFSGKLSDFDWDINPKKGRTEQSPSPSTLKTAAKV